MNWAKYFSSTILQRGRSYWHSNKVSDLRKEDDNEYSAIVEGSYDYDVSVLRKTNGGLELFCDCPYAETGNCKHEAALLYEIEDVDPDFFIYTPEKSEKKTPPAPAVKADKAEIDATLFSFPQESFFTLDSVLSHYTISPEIYSAARRLINDGKITLDKINCLYPTDNMAKDNVLLDAKAIAREREGIEVDLRFGRSQLNLFECRTLQKYGSYTFPSNNPTCYKSGFHDTSYGYYYSTRLSGKKEILCVHKTATLILVADFIRKENPGDFTNAYGLTLVQAVRQAESDSLKKEIAGRTQVQTTAVSEPVDLRIWFTLDNYGIPSLDVRIGRSKYYAVKKPVDLISQVDSQAKVSFGKAFEIDFAKATFTENFNRNLEFLRMIPPESLRERPIRIEKGWFDMFFNRFMETGVESNLCGHIAFLDGKLSFDSVVEALKDNGKPVGIKVIINAPRILSGSSFVYSMNLSNGTLIRIPIKEDSQMISLIKDAKGLQVSAEIGMTQIRDFRHRILPALQRYGSVDTSRMPDYGEETYVSPQFSFNLDYENKMVVCSTSVSYNDRDYLITPSMTVDYSSRDQIRENAVTAILDSVFEFHSDDGWMSISDDSIFSFLSEGLNLLMETGAVNVTNAFSALRLKSKPRVRASVSVEGGLMDLSIQTEDMSASELLDLLESYRKRKVYHRLKDGTFYSLDDGELGDLAAFLDSLKLGRKDLVKGHVRLPAYRALYMNKLMEERDSLTIDRSSAFRRIIRDFSSYRDSDWEIPKKLKATLRPYQEDGLRWLCTLTAYGFGGILADEMGLGKTVQVLALLLSMKERGESGTSLVVCPASLVYNWQTEVDKFAPSLKTVVIAGKQSEREKLIEKCTDYDLVITSYDLLKRDIAHYSAKSFLMQIIDEAQFIKNHGTEASKAVKLVESRLHLALTGTPVENRLSELWSIFDFLMPGLLFGREAFRSDFEIPIMKDMSSDAMTVLKKMTSPFILRRLKTDVLKDLPEKLEETRISGMGDKQRKLYDAQVVRIKDSLKGSKTDFNKSKIEILAALTRLRQICCDPSLIYEDYDGGSGKREMCLDLIESATDSGHRMLVFSQFTSMLALLQKDLENRGIAYYTITGDTPKQKRLELVEKFNGGDVPVFLISLKAGGTGLNLTGADIVIHYDPWWNTAVQNQATDRAHRIGQTKVVTVYKLIAEKTIEERIMELQETKRELADEILSGETASLSGMTKDELIALLS